MADYIHNAIVVCDVLAERGVEKAHRAATTIFGRERVTPIIKGSNGCRSFMVAPDGSGEGYPDSDRFDELRATFRTWLRNQNTLHWVEVAFGLEIAHVCDSDLRDIEQS
jgi:hypothetical protein